MKKKIALLLAAVMTLSAVPTLGLFAAANVSAPGFTDLPEKTVMPQSGIAAAGSNKNTGIKDVEYVANGTVFSVTPSATTEQLDNGFQFQIKLTNAKWIFAQGDAITFAGKATFATAATAQQTAITNATNDINSVATVNQKLTAFVADLTALLVGKTASTPLAQAEVDAIKNNVNYLAAIAAKDAIVDTTLKGNVNTELAPVVTVVGGLTTASVWSDITALTTNTDLVDAIAQTATAGTLGAAAETNLDTATAAAPADFFAPVNDSNYIKDETGYKKYLKLNHYKNGSIDYQLVVNDGEDTATITLQTGVVIAKDTTLSIPVVMYMEVAGEVTAKVDGQTKNIISTTAQKINTADKSSGTNVSVASVKAGRTKVELDKLIISETTAGVIRDHGYVKFTLTDGYIWSVVNGAIVTADPGLNMAATTLTLNSNAWLNVDKDELTVYLDGITISKVKGALNFAGLTVAPSNDTLSDDDYFGTTVKVKVEGVTSYDKNVSGSNVNVPGLQSLNVKKAENVEIAKFVDYGVSLKFDSSEAKVTDSFSGRKEVKAGKKGDDLAELKLEENATNSWWSERDLVITLTDADGKVLNGVKFNSFEITETKNITDGATSLPNQLVSAQSDTGTVNFKRDKVTVTAKKSVLPTKLGSMKFEVQFNVAANFTGDVYVNVGGYAVADAQRVKVATITAPVKVTSKTTNVAIGYQSYAVGDITVAETASGALKKDKTVDFTVREFANTSLSSGSDISFNPIKSDTLKVTAGNIKFSKLELSGAAIKATVSKESTEAATFTLSGLQVKINRSVPYGTYDLVVGGPAWVETFDSEFDKLAKNADDKGMFPIEGLVVADYVKVTTEPGTKTVAKNVQIIVGTNNAIADGKEIDMGVATYIDPASNRTMLPLRAVAYLFDISANNIIWNEANGTATLIIGDSTSQRIVSFTNGSDKMKINGVDVDMVDENGVTVKATINPENNRMYIPLRQLGIAYGIDVAWIPSTPALAIFNPTAEQKATAANPVDTTTTTDTTTEATTPATAE